MVAVSLTVGKLDASLALLLTADHHLIEFPSVLLPTGVVAGSIVEINCTQDHKAEEKERLEFGQFQDELLKLYGTRTPIKPNLRVRNATQTSVVLEWDPIDLAMADLKYLALYKNGLRLGLIPNAMTTTATKLSGLSIDTAYTYQLVLATTAGVYESDKITVRTHKMTDLSGITICTGILSDEQRQDLEGIVKRIGAKPIQDAVKIDTTHFICSEGRGSQWQRAVELNIPVVRPEWAAACEHEKRIVGVRAYYLNSTEPQRQQRVSPAASAASHPQRPSVSPSAASHPENLSVSSSSVGAAAAAAAPPTPSLAPPYEEAMSDRHSEQNEAPPTQQEAPATVATTAAPVSSSSSSSSTSTPVPGNGIERHLPHTDSLQDTVEAKKEESEPPSPTTKEEPQEQDKQKILDESTPETQESQTPAQQEENNNKEGQENENDDDAAAAAVNDTFKEVSL